MNSSENNSITPESVNTKPRNFQLRVFEEADVELWFQLTEITFQAHNIQEEYIKYAALTQALTPAVCSEMRTNLMSPDPVNPYTKLKEEILNRLTISAEKKIKQLLGKQEMGDRTPTSFLRHLRSLSAGGVPSETEEQIIKSVFLNNLPSKTKLMLKTIEPLMDVDKLALTADSVIELLESAGAINAIREERRVDLTARDPEHITQLSRQIARNNEILLSNAQLQAEQSLNMNAMLKSITEQLAQLPRLITRSNEQNFSLQGPLHNGTQERGRSNSRHRRFYNQGADYSNNNESRPTRNEAPNSNSAVHCWYHTKFGPHATNCTQPCTYPN